MSNYKINGIATFVVAGTLEAVPQIQTSQGNMSFCEFVLVVNEYNQKAKQTDTKYIPITAFDMTAENLCRYGKQDTFYVVTGNIKSREWKSKDGKDVLIMQLVAGKVLTGGQGGSDDDTGSSRAVNNNQPRRTR